MATRGRKPKPTAMKELEGNPGKHPLNTSEPKPNKKAPACPKWLEPEAKKEWRRLHTLTIYSGYNTHRLIADGSCKVYTVKRELLDVGKIIVKDNDGNMIPMYNLERTICDLMRSRSSIEAQDFNSVLKTYVSRRDKDLNRLMEYAKLFRVDNVIRRYMEVLL